MSRELIAEAREWLGRNPPGERRWGRRAARAGTPWCAMEPVERVLLGLQAISVAATVVLLVLMFLFAG